MESQTKVGEPRETPPAHPQRRARTSASLSLTDQIVADQSSSGVDHVSTAFFSPDGVSNDSCGDQASGFTRRQATLTTSLPSVTVFSPARLEVREMVEKPAHERSAKKNLVISPETVGSPDFDSLVSQLEEAKKVPLVRTIGEPEKKGGSFRAVGWLILSGAVGGLLAWVVWGLADPLFEDFETATVENIFGTVSVAVLVGMTLVIGDTLQSRAESKLGKRIGIGIGAALASGLILGALASFFYISGVETIIDDLVGSGLAITDDRFFDNFVRQNQLNRGIAWSLIGLSAGLTVGIASLQWKRILITGGGGLVGGLFGGFLFDMMPGQDAARILGLLITGLSIGAMIALTEEATKTSWVEVTHGGMAGKRFILYKSTISLGSSHSADITLIKDIDIPAIAAVLEKRSGTMRVTSVDPHQPVLVNDVEAAGGRIRDGDTITISETTLRYRERGEKAVRSEVLKS